MMKIPFSAPYIDNEVIAEVVDSLRSGWITTGPKVKLLENEIRELSGAEQVLCVNSWTSGAIMILRWFGVEPGDEVIIPAYTYSATAFAVIHAGATPVMVDINDDFNMSLQEVEKAITPRTKAILPVDFAGFPCDYDELLALAERKKDIFDATCDVQEAMGRILILADAAHSIGASYNGKWVGSQADIVIFSLHAVKNITTAEGGAICLNLPAPFCNEEIYKQLRMMSLNYQTKDALTKSKGGEWRYDIIGRGMKINMPDINAAIGYAQMHEHTKLLAERKRIFKSYDSAFADTDWAVIPPSKTEKKESSYHLYALRIKACDENFRDKVIAEIVLHGVAVNVHFVPMPMFTYFSKLGYKISDFPQSYDSYKREISLPIYPQLSSKEVDYIIKAVKESYDKVLNG